MYSVTKEQEGGWLPNQFSCLNEAALHLAKTLGWMSGHWWVTRVPPDVSRETHDVYVVAERQFRDVPEYPRPRRVEGQARMVGFVVHRIGGRGKTEG